MIFEERWPILSSWRKLWMLWKSGSYIRQLRRTLGFVCITRLQAPRYLHAQLDIWRRRPAMGFRLGYCEILRVRRWAAALAHRHRQLEFSSMTLIMSSSCSAVGVCGAHSQMGTAIRSYLPLHSRNKTKIASNNY